jgi:hypothetical protein
MKRFFKTVTLAAAAFAGLAISTSTLAANFTANYSAGLTRYNIKGIEPDDSARHPVFIYTVGTTESYDNAQAMGAVQEMAAKGFVAAAVEYDASLFGTCSQILSKAKYIYNSGSTSSAVSRLCARAKADCSKGVVVAGFSQGSVIAINAKNYDARVRAAYGMGSHNLYTTYVLNSCMNNGRTVKLNRSLLRVVNGQSDIFPGGTAITVRSSTEAVTGKSCGSTAYECLNANGSGWIMIRDNAVGDGSADHCYQRVGGCLGLQSTTDSTWRNGSTNWGLKANLDWLATFATP